MPVCSVVCLVPVFRPFNGCGSARILVDPKFPSGMKALVDYVHSKGLKFGLYSDAGEKTCEGRPGARLRLFSI